MASINVLSNGDGDVDEQVAVSSAAGGNGRRPRLQELFRIESSSSNPPDFNAAEPAADTMSDHGRHRDSSKDDDDESGVGAAVLFDLADHDEASHYVDGLLPSCVDEDNIMAPLDYGDDVKPAEAFTVNVKRIGILVAALREHSRALKAGSYWRQAAGRGRRAGDGHAELFYHRPIALGRRCRVQQQYQLE